MIAQCTNCNQTFETDEWGVQTCPHCGTQVYLERPEGGEDAGRAGWQATGAGGGGVPGGPPLGGVGQATPPSPEEARAPTAWERRGELGFVAAFFQTWKDATFGPSAFFDRMPVRDGGSAFFFGWLAYTVGGLFGALWNWMQMRAGLAGMGAAGGAEVDPALLGFIEVLYGWPMLVIVPIGAAIGLLIWAALLHLSALLFGVNKRGFDATFRVVGYSQAPWLFAIVPFFGGLVASVWSLVLVVMGLARVHRVTGGRAVLAVLFWPALLFCCAIAAGIFGAMAAAAALQG